MAIVVSSAIVPVFVVAVGCASVIAGLIVFIQRSIIWINDAFTHGVFGVRIDAIPGQPVTFAFEVALKQTFS